GEARVLYRPCRLAQAASKLERPHGAIITTNIVLAGEKTGTGLRAALHANCQDAARRRTADSAAAAACSTRWRICTARAVDARGLADMGGTQRLRRGADRFADARGRRAGSLSELSRSAGERSGRAARLRRQADWTCRARSCLAGGAALERARDAQGAA